MHHENASCMLHIRADVHYAREGMQGCYEPRKMVSKPPYIQKISLKISKKHCITIEILNNSIISILKVGGSARGLETILLGSWRPCTSSLIMHNAKMFLEYSRFYQIILNEQKC